MNRAVQTVRNSSGDAELRIYNNYSFHRLIEANYSTQFFLSTWLTEWRIVSFFSLRHCLRFHQENTDFFSSTSLSPRMFSNDIESSALFQPKFMVSSNCPPQPGGVGRKGLKSWQPIQVPSSKNDKLNYSNSRREIQDTSRYRMESKLPSYNNNNNNNWLLLLVVQEVPRWRLELAKIWQLKIHFINPILGKSLLKDPMAWTFHFMRFSNINMNKGDYLHYIYLSLIYNEI